MTAGGGSSAPSPPRSCAKPSIGTFEVPVTKRSTAACISSSQPASVDQNHVTAGESASYLQRDAVSADHPARGETVTVFGNAPALVDGVSSPILEIDLGHPVHGQLELARVDAQRTQDALLPSTEAERNALLPRPARASTVSPAALRKQTGKGLGVRGLGYGIVDLGLVANLCTVHRDDATAHLHPLFRRLHRATEPSEGLRRARGLGWVGTVGGMPGTLTRMVMPWVTRSGTCTLTSRPVAQHALSNAGPRGSSNGCMHGLRRRWGMGEWVVGGAHRCG